MHHEGEYDWMLDADDRIALPLRCNNCGYEIRQLTPTDACPECAEPVILSLRATSIAHADPIWLRTVRISMCLLSVALLLYIVAAIHPFLPHGLLPTPVLWSFLALPTLLLLIGTWLLTVPDLTGWIGRRRQSTRIATRALGTLACLTQLARDSVLIVGNPAEGHAMTGIAALVFAAFAALAGRYLYGIADQIGDRDLKRGTIGITAGLVMVLLLTGLMNLAIASTLTRGGPRPTTEFVQMAYSVTAVLWLGTILFTIIMLHNFASVFKRYGQGEV